MHAMFFVFAFANKSFDFLNKLSDYNSGTTTIYHPLKNKNSLEIVHFYNTFSREKLIHKLLFTGSGTYTTNTASGWAVTIKRYGHKLFTVGATIIPDITVYNLFTVGLQ